MKPTIASGARGNMLPALILMAAWMAGGCASDQVIQVEHKRLLDLAAQPARQAELAQEINARSKRPPISIRPRARSSPTIEARSLSVVTAERIGYELGSRSTGWVPTSAVEEIRIAHGSQALRGATVGALIGAGAAMLGGLISSSGEKSELPLVMVLPMVGLAGAAGGALWGLLFGYASDAHTVYVLPAPP